MKIRFHEFKNEIDVLIEFLTSDTWEFHGTPNPKPERISQYTAGTAKNCGAFFLGNKYSTTSLCQKHAN